MKLSLITKALLVASIALPAAYAKDQKNQKEDHKKEKQQEKQKEDENNRDLKGRVYAYRPKEKDIRPLKKPNKINETTVACGDVITESITLANDLSCPYSTGFVLKILGSNITVNANGHRIIAPSAAAGVYVEGENNIVANFVVEGITEGYGLLAYNAPSVKILNNNFSKNKIGIMVYADKTTVTPVVLGNRASFNSFAGIRTYSDDLGVISEPIIRRNDFSSTGEFAVYIKAQSYTLEEGDNNKISGSSNGYYLKEGSFRIKNVSLADQLIYKRHFFIDSASNVEMENVNVSTIAPLTPSQERMGIDLYRVAKFKLTNVVAKYHDVGLKLETESGVSTEGEIENCSFLNQSLSGIYIVSYDDTAYGTIKLINTQFTDGIGKVLVSNGTIANIVFINNTDSSGGCDEERDHEDRDHEDRDHEDRDHKGRKHEERNHDDDREHEGRDCDRD